MRLHVRLGLMGSALLAQGVLAWGSPVAPNLLANSGFEVLDEDGLPLGWQAGTNPEAVEVASQDEERHLDGVQLSANTFGHERPCQLGYAEEVDVIMERVLLVQCRHPLHHVAGFLAELREHAHELGGD